MPAAPYALIFPPGVQRDGTSFDSDTCVDALWCRFRLGRPRKILGYKSAFATLAAVGRRVHMFYNGGKTYIHIGTGKSLEQIVLDSNGNLVSHADRTPTIFASGPDAGWTIDALFDTTSAAVQVVAHSVPDISLTSSDAPTIPYIGDITSADRLKPLTNPLSYDGDYDTPKISGGVVCIQPFLFDFDSAGGVGWSAPNLPQTLGITGGTSGAGHARVSAQKIVAGMPIRGGGANSPAALFWSLSEVITAQFIGTANGGFAFNTVSPSSSILSAQSVIEYDGLYFWAGIDRFLVYNGTVVEVQNKYNQDWFFDNMNWEFAGKAFAFKVPRFGEIWFCAPLFDAQEPSHAVIYNIRENCWYDTELPNGGRGAGYFAQGFRYPVMTGVDSSGYRLWLHEYGLDEIDGSDILPIRSYFETPNLGGPKVNPPQNAATSCQFLEPDMKRSGDMTVTVTGSFNANANDFDSQPSDLKGIPTQPGEQIVGFKTERRLARLRFESNSLNGNYITGRNILHVDKGTEHVTGGPSSPLSSTPST